MFGAANLQFYCDLDKNEFVTVAKLDESPFFLLAFKLISGVVHYMLFTLKLPNYLNCVVYINTPPANNTI